MKLSAAITISNMMSLHMDQDELKSYVLNSLSNEISKEVIKHMDVEEQKDIVTDTTNYTGTLTITPTNGVGISSISTTGNAYIVNTTPNTYSSYSQINLRVVEYTKNGKVTRVELQKYDDESEDWYKIPRIQIEE
jgi:hypothetical protein